MGLRPVAFVAVSIVASACSGGGDSSIGGEAGDLRARVLWEQPAALESASLRAAQQTGTEGFGPELPGAARTVRFVFAPESGDPCCVAVDPRTIPVDPDLQQRVLVLGGLPVGPGRLTVSAFPTDFAPAMGISATCTTDPPSAGQPCDPVRGQTASFSSDEQPVNIRVGIATDAGDILVRALPFVVPGSLIPEPDDAVANPIAAGFTVADAVDPIDPSSVRLQLLANGVVVPDQPLQLEPCSDAGAVPCSAGGELDVSGFKVMRPAQEMALGIAEARIAAAAATTPPHSISVSYEFTVSGAVPTVTRTLTRTAAPTATSPPTTIRTATRTTTRTTTPVLTVTASTRTPSRGATRTPTPTRRATSTPVRSQTRTPTSGPPPSPRIVFVGAQPLTVSARPEFLASADFNRDGSADLVVISPLSTEMNILIGDSDSPSQFGEVTVFTFGDRLRKPAVGDLNNDGNADIVVPDLGIPGVWIILGNGDGTFGQPSPLSVGNIPTSVAVADFDDRPGDDLVVADRQRNAVVFRLSNGTNPLELAVGPELFAGTNTEEVITADLNVDGHADVATLNLGAVPTLGVLVWQQVTQDGTPMFAPVEAYEAGARPQNLAAADVDGDADDDLVFLNRPSGQATGELVVFLSDGEGSLVGQPSVGVACAAADPAGCPPRGLTVGDFEQDGNVDVAVALVDPRAAAGEDAVRVLQGTGSGSFVTGPSFTVGDEVTAVVAGDYGGDGPVDLAVSSSTNTSVQVLVNVSVLASGDN